jgi:hypothetical protein
MLGGKDSLSIDQTPPGIGFGASFHEDDMSLSLLRLCLFSLYVQCIQERMNKYSNNYEMCTVLFTWVVTMVGSDLL